MLVSGEVICCRGAIDVPISSPSFLSDPLRVLIPLRARPPPPSSVFRFLSTYLRHFQCGMDGCISLPVDKGALLNTVSAAVPKPRGSPPRTLATSAAAGVAAAMGWRTDKLTSALGSTSKSRASVGPAPAAAPATLPMSPVRDSRGRYFGGHGKGGGRGMESV